MPGVKSAAKGGKGKAKKQAGADEDDALLSAALAFKDAEMKKCSDLYFCRTCVRPLRAPRGQWQNPSCR